ncbi:hypothetical protein LIER_10283 [Lithospermum erythrorhizon]|uniref:VQ domain-containing protein n=1 Tax=Lithospermum erythrorhizon TaxID=34254 RepID=A0AAV3PJZ5_LITER
MLSVHDEKKPIKQQQSSKTKKKKLSKKPIKVVYIANPMKVKTSASEFSALVQELTGQDADVPDASKYSPEFEVSDSTTALKVVAEHAAVATSDEVPNGHPNTYEYQEGYNNIETFHGFDNVEMLENKFPGFEPSNLWYEN